MNREELYKKIGYNTNLCKELADVFNLQEDYNDTGWNKLFEICRHIYKLENENTNLKQALNEIREYIYKNSIPINLLSNPPKETMDFEGNINDVLQIIDNYMKEDD